MRDFTMIPVEEVTSAEQARDLAVSWAIWQSEQALSWGELHEHYTYFNELATKYPELRDELVENGVI